MQELFDRCYAMKHCGVTLERPAGRRESGRMLYNVFMLRAAGRARGRGRLCAGAATGRRTGRGHAT